MNAVAPTATRTPPTTIKAPNTESGRVTTLETGSLEAPTANTAPPTVLKPKAASSRAFLDIFPDYNQLPRQPTIRFSLAGCELRLRCSVRDPKMPALVPKNVLKQRRFARLAGTG